MSHSFSRRGTAVPQQMSLIDQIYRHGRVVTRPPHDTSPAAPTVSSGQDQSSPQEQISPSFLTPTLSSMPTGTLPQSWSALPSSTSHEEALDLIDDVLDDTPEEHRNRVKMVPCL